MNYAEMMQRYAAVAGLPRRRILPVPLFTPSLSSHWVGLITPVPAVDRPAAGRVAAQHRRLPRARHRASTCRTRPAGLLGFDEAVRLALQRVKDAAVGDPLVLGVRARRAVRSAAHRSRLGRRQRLRRRAHPDDRRLARGAVAGRRGHRRGAPAGTPSRWRGRSAAGWTGWSAGWACGAAGAHPHDLYVGEALDFWRVEALEEGSLLRLRAEMRLPGLAWLEFHVEHEDAADGTRPGCAPAGHVRPARPARPPLLVGGRPVPRHRLRRDAAQHHPRRGAARLTDRACAPASWPSVRSWLTVRGPGSAVDGEPGPGTIRSPDHHRAHTSSWAVASSR